MPLGYERFGVREIFVLYRYILTLICSQTNMFFVAEVAQSVEHSTENAGVVSSILTLGTLFTRAIFWYDIGVDFRGIIRSQFVKVTWR